MEFFGQLRGYRLTGMAVLRPVVGATPVFCWYALGEDCVQKCREGERLYSQTMENPRRISVPFLKAAMVFFFSSWDALRSFVIRVCWTVDLFRYATVVLKGCCKILHHYHAITYSQLWF
jgi:hypothetical protein